MKDRFFSPTKGALSFAELLGELFDFLSKAGKDRVKIIIGTDSKARRTDTVFVTVLAVHRLGKGGRFFWQKNRVKNINSLRHRVWQEVNFSLVFTQKLIEGLKRKHWFSPELLRNLEIHVDIGQQGETKEMIREIVGYITQNGFTAKIKPESFGASVVADRLCD